jgi:major membrane immunogen (membrane-anchored lipoprotein)
MEKIWLVIITTLLLIACSANDYLDSTICEGHGGVQLCYRDIGTTHGHIMCQDGTTTSKECY